MEHRFRRYARLTVFCLPCLASGCAGLSIREPGFRVPWTRYEAEEARSNGEIPAASRTYLTPESEAAGRRFARLEKSGDFVEFIVRAPADGLVLRYAIPDAADGRGIDATLSLFINGVPQPKLHLTSRYAWSYGDFPWTNDPAAGRGHHFFDEMHVRIPAVKKDNTVRLQIDHGDTAAYYLIDFIELESVPPPLPPPANSVSILDFGGVPDDGADDAEALIRLIDAARGSGKIGWIPAGTYTLGGSYKRLGGMELRGAGFWHTRLTGSAPFFYGSGERFHVSDLAIFGEVTQRNDHESENPFTGNLGDGSVIERIWIEHMKCGIWANHGTTHLRVEDCRIRNTMADGINLCDGTSDSMIARNHLRNTGDDAIATWSPTAAWSSRQPSSRNRFIRNIIENPWHANGLGVYGGKDNEFRGNLVTDTVASGGGMLVSSGHGALPFEGFLRVEDNRFVRTGGECYIDGRNGSLWVHAYESDITADISFRRLLIEDPDNAGVSIHGPRAIRNMTFESLQIEKPGKTDIEIMPGTSDIEISVDGRRLMRP